MDRIHGGLRFTTLGAEVPRNHRWGDTSAGFVTQFVGPLSRYGRITHKQELGQLRFRGQLFRRAAVSLTRVDDFQ